MNSVISSFLKDSSPARHQIDSYDYFIQTELKKIVKLHGEIYSDIDEQFYLCYTNIWVGEPRINENMITRRISPNECRARDLSYTAPIYVDIKYVRGNEEVTRKEICIGHMPVMIKSSVCHTSRCERDEDYVRLGESSSDKGGYFIIKGTEKLLLIQEHPSKNRILLEKDKKGVLKTTLTSITVETKSRTVVIIKKKKFYVTHNILKEPIPLCVFMRAFGIEKDWDILVLLAYTHDLFDLKERVLIEEKYYPSFREAASLNIFKQKEALEYISMRISTRSKIDIEKEQDRLLELLSKVILSNIEMNGLDMREKALVLAIMASRIVQCEMGLIEPDDKDYLGNKRYEVAGSLLALLFEDLFKRYNSSLKKNIDSVLKRQNRAQRFDAITLMTLQSEVITTGLTRSIGFGNWTIGRFRTTRTGMSEVVSRLSHIAAISLPGRITCQFEKTRKLVGPRAVNISQWGRICPSDSPDGDSCGLMKHLSMIAKISREEEEDPIIRASVLLGMKEISVSIGDGLFLIDSMVFLNGRPIGVVTDAELFTSRLRGLRRRGHLPPTVSICSQKRKEIIISCDDGRLLRPVIVVENKKSLVEQEDIEQLLSSAKSFHSLVLEGKVEYLDVTEENTALIATEQSLITEETTHLELDSCAFLGIVTGTIPYSNHNQAPRNSYQCSMARQAMGVIGENQNKRCDGVILSLVYPQIPLVMTESTEASGYRELPAGTNSIIAVTSFSGYDVEDALVLNKASLERGYQRCTVTKKTLAACQKYPNNTCDFIRPRFDKQDGIVSPGEIVKDGGVLFNKFLPIQRPDGKFKSGCVFYKHHTEAVVEKVVVSSSEEKTIAKIMLRQTRSPEIGDKFSSRHGQKGVCGIICPQEDMPFTENGVSPDIIMNPHGFPSRMTVGKLIEVVASKNAAVDGRYIDGTAFRANTEDLCTELMKKGFSYSGKETMISGITGKEMPCDIFVGPVYYQRLKHMVSDKIHARARGPKTVMTRQPTEGRGRDGGLRVGEMERDCLIGHGASSLLYERLVYSSDLTKVLVCEECGMITYREWCSGCNSGDSISKTDIPYACKLLLHELISMGILPKLILGDLSK
eukprot:GHVP01060756.1.p1 GENE.GHVP01060756.1~~GHVP01060756.1.p1  ORF type:complete len:1091 (+),score=117.69 GHVP01060756.1:543-3815(+)